MKFVGFTPPPKAVVLHEPEQVPVVSSPAPEDATPGGVAIRDKTLSLWSPQAKCMIEYIGAITPNFSRSEFLAHILEDWARTNHPHTWACATQRVEGRSHPHLMAGPKPISVNRKLIGDIAKIVVTSRSSGAMTLWSPAGKIVFEQLAATISDFKQSTFLRQIVEVSLDHQYPNLWAAACDAVANELKKKKMKLLQAQLIELTR